MNMENQENLSSAALKYALHAFRSVLGRSSSLHDTLIRDGTDHIHPFRYRVHPLNSSFPDRRIPHAFPLVISNTAFHLPRKCLHVPLWPLPNGRKSVPQPVRCIPPTRPLHRFLVCENPVLRMHPDSCQPRTASSCGYGQRGEIHNRTISFN